MSSTDQSNGQVADCQITDGQVTDVQIAAIKIEDGQTNSACTEESSATQMSVENKVETSKYSIRRQVWTHFEKNRLVSFPRPVRGRIPNFPGAPETAAKLAELEIFQNATYIKVNADKPQENVRILTLEKEKKLLVPAPRVQEAVFMEVVPENKTKADLKKAASRRGMLEWGKPIDMSTDIKIDLVVVGSVAVSREGHRIGKGVGFGDLEFATLVEIGAITENTVIVTTVHESQVFETLPPELFKEYDIPVDIIITPNEVINVADRLPRPKGVFWNLLTQKKLNLMAVLKVLREKEIESGKECHLKEADTDSDIERTRRNFYPIRRYVRFAKKRSAAKSEGDKTGEEGKEESPDKEKKTEPVKRFKRRPIKRMFDPNDSTNEGDSGKQKRMVPYRRRFPRPMPIQFSLRIGNISSNVRVRDLKNALAERNVKPTDITWRGHKGFAFIHFAKPKKEPETPVLVDSIVASLQDMKINVGDEGITLLVEPAKPITRIETTDITAV